MCESGSLVNEDSKKSHPTLAIVLLLQLLELSSPLYSSRLDMISYNHLNHVYPPNRKTHIFFFLIHRLGMGMDKVEGKKLLESTFKKKESDSNQHLLKSLFSSSIFRPYLRWFKNVNHNFLLI